MQNSNGRRATRYFGVVTKVFDDGACSIRKLDGTGEVTLDAQHARRVGRELFVGTRLEFEVRYVHSAAGQVAVDACAIEHARALPARAGSQKCRHLTGR